MGALSRFSDSLLEMEPSCPHPGGHRGASRATGRPFPWLEDCALSADPLGFARKQHFSSHQGAPSCLAHRSMEMCMFENSALQLPPSPVPHSIPIHPSCWNVVMSFSPLSPAPHLPWPRSDAVSRGGTPLPSTPTTCTLVIFPVGPMGKDQREEWYLLELSIVWMSVSQIPVKVLMGGDLGRKSLGDLHFLAGRAAPSLPSLGDSE